MWIQTATGGKFHLLQPTTAEVNATDILAALPLVPCFAGQQEAGRHEYAYSVAQHCLLVSYLVPDEFALDGLLHDAWKVYIGDLTRPLNQLLKLITNGRWRTVRNRVQRAVALRFNTRHPLPAEVEEGDLLARATELRDVMAPPPEPWSLKLPKPHHEIIIPQSPMEVRRRFERRWAELDPNFDLYR